MEEGACSCATGNERVAGCLAVASGAQCTVNLFQLINCATLITRSV